MKIAIVGATGLVGQVMLKVLAEFDLPISTLVLAASPRSVGNIIHWQGTDYTVCSVEDAIASKPDIAIFSAGSSTSKKYAKAFTAIGSFVIDNSSCWRMDPTVPLVVPEVNGSVLSKDELLIANPNCSTMQMMLPLKPLHDTYGIKRLVISTYQSFTGTGSVAVRQYETEKEGHQVSENDRAYPHPIFANCLPHCGDFEENAYTTEEIKLVNETRKILNAPEIQITATAVRVPVFGGHSESVNIEFENDFRITEVLALLDAFPGVQIMDDIENNHYPTPLQAHDKNDVFVGRIRRDHSIKKGLNMWIVSDNLRKGAATNTVQIAKYLLDNKLLKH